MNNQANNRAAADNWPSHGFVFRPAKSWQIQALLLTATLLAASVAACAPVDLGGTRDVGNMAYPDPLPQGNLDTVTLSGRQPRDTGNMAYPAPSPVGNIATTTVR